MISRTKRPHGLKSFYGRSPAETAGSNPAGGMRAFQLWVLCVVRVRLLRRADHSSRGVLPNELRRCLWTRNLENEAAITRVGPQHHRKKVHIFMSTEVRESCYPYTYRLAGRCQPAAYTDGYRRLLELSFPFPATWGTQEKSHFSRFWSRPFHT